jgi:hypothetical protein
MKIKHLLFAALVAIPLPENTTSQITVFTNGVPIGSFTNVVSELVLTPVLSTTYALVLNGTNLMFYQETQEIPEVLDELAWTTNKIGNPYWSFMRIPSSRSLRSPKSIAPAAPLNMRIEPL